MAEWCPVCLNVEARDGHSDFGERRYVICPRCGPYEISTTAVDVLSTHAFKEPLTRAGVSHAIRTQTSEHDRLFVNSSSIEIFVRTPLPDMAGQLKNLVMWIASRLHDNHHGRILVPQFECLAGVVGAVNGAQVEKVLKRSVKRELVVTEGWTQGIGLSPKGWEFSLDSNTTRSQAAADAAAEQELAALAQLNLWPDGKVPNLRSVNQLRQDAADLRSAVSQGSYGDEELQSFWEMTATASLVLRMSNADLSARAGLGDNFFMSVSRDRRRPKLANFLRALTAIIDVADIRLKSDRRSSRRVSPSGAVTNERIAQNYDSLWLLSVSLGRTARNEIERLDAERLNSPEAIEQGQKQRDLLLTFAEGFERIADALALVADHPNERSPLNKASDVVKSVGNKIEEWWKDNGAEAIDWGFRLPVLAGGVGLLNLAGAQMGVATVAVAALVGGQKVASVLVKRKSKS